MTSEIIIDGIPCVTPEVAATQLGWSLPTLHRRVRNGVIQQPVRRHGRTWFVRAEIDRLASEAQAQTP